MTTLKELTATGKQFGGMLAAHSIATTLKYWYHGSPYGEIVSLGVLSEGKPGSFISCNIEKNLHVYLVLLRLCPHLLSLNMIYKLSEFSQFHNCVPYISSCDYCAVQGKFPQSPQVRLISVCLLYSPSIVFLHQKAYYILPLSMVWLDSYVPCIRVCTPYRQGFAWVSFMGKHSVNLVQMQLRCMNIPLCEFKSAYYLFSEIVILNLTFICRNFN